MHDSNDDRFSCSNIGVLIIFYRAGEGSIPGVKQRIKHMKQNFASNVVKGFLQASSLTKLLGTLCDSINESEDLHVTESTRNMVHCCEALGCHGKQKTKQSQILTHQGGTSDGWTSGGLVVKDGERVHQHKDGSHPIDNQAKAVPVVIDESTGHIWYVEKDQLSQQNTLFSCVRQQGCPHNVGGAWYFRYSEEKSGDFDRKYFQLNRCLCGLMLQHPTKPAEYHIVRTDWKELIFDENLNKAFFALPRYRKANYKAME